MWDQGFRANEFIVNATKGRTLAAPARQDREADFKVVYQQVL